MNRQIVRYSALGSVAVAAVVGVVCFCLLGDATAEGDAGEQSAGGAPAAATTKPAAGPDRLFAEPVQVWNQDRKPSAPETLSRDRPQILRTSYDDEPGHFYPDPAANPLATAGDAANERAQASTMQLVAGNDDVKPERATDPFGLRNANGGAASKAAPKTTSGPTMDPFGAKAAQSKKSPAKANPQDSPYGDPPNFGKNGTIKPFDAAPLDGTPFSSRDGRGDSESAAADAVSVFDTRGRDSGNTAAIKRGGPGTGSAYGQANDPAARFTPAAKSSRPGELSENQLDDPQMRSIEDDGIGPIGIDAPSNPFNGKASTSADAFSGNSDAGTIGSAVVRPTSSGTRAQLAPLGGPQGSGRPGSRQVEGKQTPQITIEKIAPDEIQVGKTARFELHVRNTGTVVAQGVEVRDLVPEGTQFVTANPPASPGPQGELVWTLGALKPSDEHTIEIELRPLVEGEVGSVATVTFQAEAGVRSRVTKPDLSVQVTAAKQVMIGQDVVLAIKITNPGTGPATGVVLEERVPAGLKHPSGGELEFEVGMLKPGESRELELVLSAVQAGRVVNQIAARGEANLRADTQCEIEVIAPGLEVSMDGPAKRYLERQATYTVSVTNPGTAPAKDVELVTRLPKGLKFVKANNAGQYNPQTHSVVWSLEELPPAETGTVTLTALPVEPGEQRLRAEGKAKQGLTDEQEQITVVEGLAALLFEVVDVADPIEVKGETEYEIRITNQGSKAADNVQLVAMLPPELKFVSAEGPTRYAIDGDRVVFEPLGRLSPKADTTYRVAVQGTQPGDVRMKVQLMTDDMRQPVTKEESTRVYSDE
jgi:uncharacterized repeat protein (TIGR01451 family)